MTQEFHIKGLHPHLFNNVLDIQPTEENEEGDVLQLNENLKPFWGSPTGGVSALRLYIPFGSGEDVFSP